MNSYLIVFFGAGIGGALRHAVNQFGAKIFGYGFPSGTLIVNVSGSLIMGILIGYFALQSETSQNWKLFLTTGILGGFTTFSAFALDIVTLYERGDHSIAITYAIISVGASIGATIIGMLLLRQLSA